jgi:hypothetical protein
MARGRFVSKTISLDEKVNALSDDTARLLFTWLITHLDCEGRMYGDAQTVKSIIFPRRSISIKKIEKYLKELEISGLIFRYSVNGNQYLCQRNFEKHQPGLRKDKETPSQIPSFTPELGRSEDGKSRGKVKDKDKGNTPKGGHHKALSTEQGKRDSVIAEIFTEMKTFLGFPDKVDKDPIPSYGREGSAIKRMLTRGFTREAILECWNAKVLQRGGEFVSMTWVNQDIGQGEKPKRRPKELSTEAEIAASIKDAEL